MNYYRYQELLVYRALIEKLLKLFYEKELGCVLDFRLKAKEFTINRSGGHRRQEFRRPDLRCQDVLWVRMNPEMTTQQFTYFLDTIKERLNFFILFVEPNTKFATSIKVMLYPPYRREFDELVEWFQDGDDVYLELLGTRSIRTCR